MTDRISERLAIVATIDPDNYSASTYATDVVDMSRYRRVIFVLLTGDLGSATATLQLQVYANTTNAASGGTAITSKVFTAATFSGSGSANGDDKQGIIEVTGAEVAAALTGARYVYAVLTVGTAASDCAVAVLASNARYDPASDNDLASVKEIITA